MIRRCITGFGPNASRTSQPPVPGAGGLGSGDAVIFSGFPVANRLEGTTFRAQNMAKKAWIERNKRRERTVSKYVELRKQLKAEKDYIGLSMLPRDASPTRLVNRCEVTGRRRAFIRRFKLSRITFRELASQGMIPGVTKSSW